MHQRKFAKALIPVAVGFALTAHPVLGGESAPRMQPNNSWISISGIVEKVNSDDESFVMDMAGIDIKVQTDKLSYNPLDDMGFQQIDVGDRVSITGNLDYEFIDGRVFKADFVTTVDEKGNS